MEIGSKVDYIFSDQIKLYLCLPRVLHITKFILYICIFLFFCLVFFLSHLNNNIKRWDISKQRYIIFVLIALDFFGCGHLNHHFEVTNLKDCFFFYFCYHHNNGSSNVCTQFFMTSKIFYSRSIPYNWCITMYKTRRIFPGIFNSPIKESLIPYSRKLQFPNQGNFNSPITDYTIKSRNESCTKSCQPG